MNLSLNYHHLYYFKTIAQAESIAKAAQLLRIGQPALSMQLKQLEAQLGVQLFERKHKGLILTEAGRVALNYSLELFRLGSEMQEVLQDKIVPSRMHVQLGALDSIPKHVIARLVEATYKIQKCRVTVLEGKDDDLLRELQTHKIDLILTNHIPKRTGDEKLFWKSLGKFSVWVCGSKKWKTLQADFPNSLNHKPFIMPTFHSKLRSDIEHFFSSHNIHIDEIAETQDTSLQKILGRDGVGLVPLSEISVESLIKSGELFKIGELMNVQEEIFLVSASRRIENPISQHLFKNFRF
jgi:LysR family transcriptional regulator, transcriptional activator of nhaA